ncbi:MAG: DNA polymerase III subunit delta [Chthoniobacterales bacterium]
MPAATTKNPKSEIRNPKSFHFVTGSDEAAVKNAAAELAASLAPSDDPLSVETIDGADANAERASECIALTIEALLTVAFFGGAKLVWLKNASFLADSVTGRSDAVAASLDRLLDTIEKGIPPDVTFLISAPEADKRRAAYKKLSKLAATTLHDKPSFGWGATEADVVDWVEQKISARQLRFTPDAAAILAARVGAETRQIESELDKLSLAFPSDHEITEDDVRELVPTTRAGGIFDLSNAIAKRDLQLSLATLRQLFAQNERAVGILLAAIIPTVRNLLLVKDLMDRHRIPVPGQPQFFAGALKKLPEKATDHLPRKKDGTLSTYPLGIAATNSRRFEIDELQDAYLACAQANRTLVTSAAAESVVLDQLIVRICGRD